MPHAFHAHFACATVPRRAHRRRGSARPVTRFCRWVPGELRGDVGQDDAEWGSPVCSGDGEEAMDAGAEGLISVGRAPVTGDVNGEFPQLQEGEGK
jgi:hypothetical protein